MRDLLALWLWLPIAGRLAVLFVAGTALGSLINVAVARFGFTRARIGPWSSPPPGAAPRSTLARLPVVGWLALRGEASWHGPRFWLRPFAIEILMGLAVPALYWYEAVELALVPQAFVRPPQPLGLVESVHLQFAAHVLLLTFMLAASVIDADEQLIPDAITVPGALLGLVFAFVLPRSHLPIEDVIGTFSPLFLSSPQLWPASLDAGRPAALALALACFAIWCLGLLPRPWRTRHGYAFAVRLLTARMFRTRGVGWIWLMAILGAALVAAAWSWAPADAWRGLLTALVGVFGGGVVIWLVRVVGTAVMSREAMGFGDVTLLAMIGAYLGWQACLIVFFLAPFFGLAFGIVQLIARRENVLPYGPFLCMAAAAVVIWWRDLWQWAEPAFRQGLIVPIAIAVSMVALGAMLALWKGLSDLFARGR